MERTPSAEQEISLDEQEISLEELDIKVTELADTELVARPTQTVGH